MKKIHLKAIKDNIEKVSDFVQEEMEDAGFPMKAQMQVAVAIDEIFVNIANYAYGDKTGDAEVQVDFEDDGDELVLRFIDRGIPFNPLKAKLPDVTLPAEEREIGGLGILIVKKTMDGMKYCREDGKNILVLRKKRK